MKSFIILLIVSFTVFTIDAVSLQLTNNDDSLDSSEFVKIIIKAASTLVNHVEKAIPGWDVKAALDVNVIKLVDKLLENGDVLGWNQDADIEDNLVNVVESYFNVIPLEGLNVNASIADNLATFVDDVDLVPFPPFISKVDFEAKLVEKILNSLSSIPEIDVNQSVHDNLVSWISSSLEKAQVIDPTATAEEQVNYLIDLLFDEIKLPGFSPSKTLDANVIDVLAALLG